MQAQQDRLNGNMHAFALAFSNVIKDATSHLATKDDINELSERISRVETRLDKVEQTVTEGYKRIYSWKDDMYKNFPRKEDLKPSAFKEVH